MLIWVQAYRLYKHIDYSLQSLFLYLIQHDLRPYEPPPPPPPPHIYI